MTNEHDQIIRHGAYAIIIKNSQLLLTQKQSGPYCGLWGLPGGGIEYGETPEDTVIRELQEEVAIAVEQLEFFDIATATNIYTTNEKSYGFHHVGLLYNVFHWVNIPHRIPEEQSRWVDIEHIQKKELTPFAQYVVKKIVPKDRV